MVAAPRDEDAQLYADLAREGIAWPPEWLPALAAECRDLRARIARMREVASP